MKQEQHMQIASTIISQLGNKALTMIGAKAFAALPANSVLVPENCRGALRFQIGRNSKQVRYIKIQLTYDDLYDVEYIRNNGEVISSEDGIYADMLHDSIERNTGMYTSL